MGTRTACAHMARWAGQIKAGRWVRSREKALLTLNKNAREEQKFEIKE